MRKLSVALLLPVLWLAACGSSRPYGATGEAIGGALYAWRPAGTDQFHQPSEAESAQSRADMQVCLSELSARLSKSNKSFPGTRLHPSKEERVLDVISCMEPKGWLPVKLEIIVTSALRSSKHITSA